MKNFKTLEELNIEVTRINLTQLIDIDGRKFEIFAKVNCINFDTGDIKPNDIELTIRQNKEDGSLNVFHWEELIPVSKVNRKIWKICMNWVMTQLNSIDIQHNDSSEDVKITH
jgi:hypothetical protein